MAMNIKSAEAEALARKVAGATGESLTLAILTSLRERWDRLQRQKQSSSLAEELNELAQCFAALPVQDLRSA